MYLLQLLASCCARQEVLFLRQTLPRADEPVEGDDTLLDEVGREYVSTDASVPGLMRVLKKRRHQRRQMAKSKQATLVFWFACLQGHVASY
jgi:hypothetical protein